MSRTFRQALFVAPLVATTFFPVPLFADTLFVSPSAGSYKVGQTFAIRMVVSSPAQAINAVSANLSFPADKLQVTSISKVGSILNLWVAEPSFSNGAGTVSLEGVVPNPGFQGQSGPVLTVNFRVVGTGSATVSYSSGQLLANDGYGTNVLRTRNSATFALEAAPPAEEKKPAVEKEPVAPEVYVDLTPPAEEAAEAPKAEAPKEEKKVSVELPDFSSVIDFATKFFSLVIPLVALVYFLIHTAQKGTGNIRGLRKRMRKDLHDIDRLVEKSFDLLKEDISESIHILERTRVRRRLTAEEDAIIHRLRQNLVDAEKIIHREVLNAEKNIGE